MQIHFVDALAGAGKTHAAIQYAITQAASGAKIAIVQPSTALLDETHKNLIKQSKNLIQITKLHSSCTTQVKDAVQNHLRCDAAPGVGEILLITHQTFLTLPHWHNALNWDVIVDELPQIEDAWVENLPNNHATLTSHVQLHRTTETYCQISTKHGSESKVQRMAENLLNDAQDRLYQPICQKLHNSQTWTTYTNVKSWDKIVADTELGKHQITTFSLLQPETFAKYKSVTIMGAMFKDSVLFLLWKDKVAFVEHAEITKNLRPYQHANGNLLTIKYMFTGTWSKTLKDSTTNGEKISTQVQEHIEQLLEGRQFIYAANTSDKLFQLGIRVDNNCHGLNKFQSINNVVFFSALNASPANYKFMEQLGVTPELLRKARGHQTMYQTIMRSSLRDPNNTNSKTVIVGDLEQAEYLAALFPGCTVERIEEIQQPEKKKLGRPATGKAMSNAERQRKRRERLKQEKQ